MNSHALDPWRRWRHRSDSPSSAADPDKPADSGLTALARDAGFRTPDHIATPEMAAQAGMPLGVLRWLPLFVAGLVAILATSIGLLVLSVL